MTNSDNKHTPEPECPLCGKSMNKGDEFCKNCQEIAQYSDKLNLASDNETEGSEKEAEAFSVNIEETPIIKKKKTSLFIILALIIVIIATGTVGSYVFIQNKEAESTETAYWLQCISENTTLSYSKYLVQYPKGLYSDEAYSRIEKLKGREKEGWINLQNSKDINSYYSYLVDYPNTPYEQQIRSTIDSLGWEETKADDTKEAYSAYLQNVESGYFEGKYRSMAEKRYEYLDKIREVEGTELTEIKDLIVKFFKNLSSNKYADIEKQLSSNVTYFMDLKDQSKNEIISSIKKNMKDNKIKNIDYDPIIDSIRAIQDNTGVYFLSLPLNQQIIYIDRKKAKTDSHFLFNIELNKEKEIISLNKKE